MDGMEKRWTYRAPGKSGKNEFAVGKQVVEMDNMESLESAGDKWLAGIHDTVEVIYYPKEVIATTLWHIAENNLLPCRKKTGWAPTTFLRRNSMAGYTPYGYLGYDHQRQATWDRGRNPFPFLH